VFLGQKSVTTLWRVKVGLVRTNWCWLQCEGQCLDFSMMLG